jgi:hypothetical protein
MTANGWRQIIPLHKRGSNLLPQHTKFDLCKEDAKMLADWEEKHKYADAIVCDTRTGYPIQAIYNSPATMHMSEKVDFLHNIAKLNFEED